MVYYIMFCDDDQVVRIAVERIGVDEVGIGDPTARSGQVVSVDRVVGRHAARYPGPQIAESTALPIVIVFEAVPTAARDAGI